MKPTTVTDKVIFMYSEKNLENDVLNFFQVENIEPIECDSFKKLEKLRKDCKVIFVHALLLKNESMKILSGFSHENIIIAYDYGPIFNPIFENMCIHSGIDAYVINFLYKKGKIKDIINEALIKKSCFKNDMVYCY